MPDDTSDTEKESDESAPHAEKEATDGGNRDIDRLEPEEGDETDVREPESEAPEIEDSETDSTDVRTDETSASSEQAVSVANTPDDEIVASEDDPGEKATDSATAQSDDSSTEYNPFQTRQLDPGAGHTAEVGIDSSIKSIKPQLEEFQMGQDVNPTLYCRQLESYVTFLQSRLEALEARCDEKERHVKTLKQRGEDQNELIRKIKEEQDEEVEKRVERERSDLLYSFIRDVRDPLSRMLDHETTVDRSGVDRVISKFDTVLQDFDAEIIEPEIGMELDRGRHSILSVESGEDDWVVESIHSRGLLFHGDGVQEKASVIVSGTSQQQFDEKPGEESSDDDSRSKCGDTDRA